MQEAVKSRIDKIDQIDHSPLLPIPHLHSFLFRESGEHFYDMAFERFMNTVKDTAGCEKPRQRQMGGIDIDGVRHTAGARARLRDTPTREEKRETVILGL